MALTTFRGTNRAFGMMTVAASLSIGVLFGTTTAQAQTIPTAVTKPFALKVGAYNPSEDTARRASSDVLFSIEAEYTIQNLVELNSSYSVFSVGYINEGDLRIIPITIGQNWTDGKQNYFYGGGIGLYNVKMDLAGFTSNQDKYIFGFYGTVGLNLTKQVFAELKYHYPYKYDDQFVGGFQLMAGYRF
ncbi:MAG: outer membrane beta-barrel protein [Akkermansiaceae bacterium]|nr:outer membrane beta-barrel protein [Armatimonadota bacterium]